MIGEGERVKAEFTLLISLKVSSRGMEEAERWTNRWRSIPPPSREKAQIISDVTPLPPSQVTPEYIKQ